VTIPANKESLKNVTTVTPAGKSGIESPEHETHVQSFLENSSVSLLTDVSPSSASISKKMVKFDVSEK